jgi:hypothetical protein
MEPNITPRRLCALQYAAGQSDAEQPTIGVSRPLEKAGLIHWCGAFGVGFARVQNTECNRPWKITERGKSTLTKWLKNET